MGSSFRSFYPVVFKVVLEEILEFRLCYKVFGLGAMFILMPLLDNCSVEKRGGKMGAVKLVGSNSFEIIFTVLVKTIVIKM